MHIEETSRNYIFSDSFLDCPLLDKRQKEVVIQRVKNKLTYTKIAEIIKVSPPQASNIFERALYIIKIYLTEKTPSTLIKDTNLSQRIKNAYLNDEKIKCLSDFNGLSTHEILRRNLGKASLNEINLYIKDLGYSLVFLEEKKEFDGSFKKEFFSHLSDHHILNLISSLCKFMNERRCC